MHSLLEITTGYYGQPLPSGYKFPHFTLGDPDRLLPGDPLSIIGYPSIGGSGSRPTLTMTQGIVAGGEKVAGGTLLKTDAGISSGNSGGAVVNKESELIGIPSFIIENEGESLGFILPLSMVPTSWFDPGSH